jgi:hypothetical protein
MPPARIVASSSRSGVRCSRRLSSLEVIQGGSWTRPLFVSQ